MYALMTQWQADEKEFSNLTPTLRAEIVPSLEQTPGFISGYWVWDHATSKTYDMVLYETEEQARAQKSNVEQVGPTEGPIRFELARVAEVVAHAGAKQAASTSA